MGRIVLDMSMSLDGFISGPDDDKDHGLGINGEVAGLVPTEEWHNSRRSRGEGFSMGHALNTAIGEGATMVRLGTVLFGPRE